MISINATLIVQVINFLVLIYILNKVLFKPIFKIMEEREQRVVGVRAEAEKFQTESEEKLKEFEDRIFETRQANRRLRQEAKSEANSDAIKIIDKAREEAQGHIASIKQETTREAQRVKDELASYQQQIVNSLFAKVLGREVS